MTPAWTQLWSSNHCYTRRKHYAEWVIAELATLDDRKLDAGISRVTHDFMANKVDECVALIAAYTFCVLYRGSEGMTCH